MVPTTAGDSLFVTEANRPVGDFDLISLFEKHGYVRLVGYRLQDLVDLALAVWVQLR